MLTIFFFNAVYENETDLLKYTFDLNARFQNNFRGDEKSTDYNRLYESVV